MIDFFEIIPSLIAFGKNIDEYTFYISSNTMNNKDDFIDKIYHYIEYDNFDEINWNELTQEIFDYFDVTFNLESGNFKSSFKPIDSIYCEGRK